MTTNRHDHADNQYHVAVDSAFVQSIQLAVCIAYDPSIATILTCARKIRMRVAHTRRRLLVRLRRTRSRHIATLRNSHGRARFRMRRASRFVRLLTRRWLVELRDIAISTSSGYYDYARARDCTRTMTRPHTYLAIRPIRVRGMISTYHRSTSSHMRDIARYHANTTARYRGWRTLCGLYTSTTMAIIITRIHMIRLTRIVRLTRTHLIQRLRLIHINIMNIAHA